MTCTSCGQAFIFDPKSDHRLTDSRMDALIRRTSADGRYVFFESQLLMQYIQLALKLSSGRFVGCFIGTIFMGLSIYGVGALVMSANVDGGAVLFTTLFGMAGLVAFLTSVMMTPGLTMANMFQAHLSRWSSRRPIEGLLTPSTRRLEGAPAKAPERDIFDYGVERVLLVSKPDWVDFFVLGGFHAAHRALVMDVSGYPQYLRKQLERILAEQPHVPIFILHDVGESAQEIERQARALTPLLATKALMDISPRPGDIFAIDQLNKQRKLLTALRVHESLMLLHPQRVHTLVEGAMVHRATTHELLRGQRDDSSVGFIGADGGDVGALDLMVISDFG